MHNCYYRTDDSTESKAEITDSDAFINDSVMWNFHFADQGNEEVRTQLVKVPGLVSSLAFEEDLLTC